MRYSKGEKGGLMDSRRTTMRSAIQFSRRITVLVLTVLWLCQTPLLAGIYKWEDIQGKIYFTDDTSRIPLKYRAQMEKFKGVAEPSPKNRPEPSTGAKNRPEPSTGASGISGVREMEANQEVTGGETVEVLKEKAPGRARFTQGVASQGIGGADTRGTSFLPPNIRTAEAEVLKKKDKDIGSFPPSIPPTLTLTDSPPILVTTSGQIIENVRIVANGEPAILIRNFSGVIIRNVEIRHQGADGILCMNAPGLTITNVSITHTGTASPNANAGENNINCENSDGMTVDHVRLEGGSSGAYIVRSDDVQMRFVEGYNFRGPFPRGQLVQFNESPGCLLEDFSAINDLDPSISWPEDNVSVFRSDHCIVRRGLLDGNNSSHGVGVMFEKSNDGLVEDVDTVRQGNGSFAAYPGNNVIFRRTRARDNFCDDQGRGLPSSNSLVWVGKPGSSGLRINDSKYFNLCSNNRVWDRRTFTLINISSEDFQLRKPIVNEFAWETATVYTESTAVANLDGIGQDDILVDFGASHDTPRGLWAWMNNNYWEKLHNVSPEGMTAANLDGKK